MLYIDLRIYYPTQWVFCDQLEGGAPPPVKQGLGVKAYQCTPPAQVECPHLLPPPPLPAPAPAPAPPTLQRLQQQQQQLQHVSARHSRTCVRVHAHSSERFLLASAAGAPPLSQVVTVTCVLWSSAFHICGSYSRQCTRCSPHSSSTTDAKTQTSARAAKRQKRIAQKQDQRRGSWQILCARGTYRACPS